MEWAQGSEELGHVGRTRSQAVARTADRTASQQTTGI